MPTNVTFPGNLGQTETIADLRDLPSTFIDPGTIYVVKGVGRAYSYDPGSLAVDDGLNVIRPNDRTPLQAGRFLYEVDGIASGPKGDTGAANSTYVSLATLKAASVANSSYIFAPPAGNDGVTTAGTFLYQTAGAPYTADDVNVIKLDGIPLTTGALVRQGAQGITAQALETGAVPISQSDKNRTSVSVFEFIPASLHAGILARTVDNDKTRALQMVGYIQNAIDAAAAKRRLLTVPAGVYNLAPPGRFNAEAGAILRCIAIRSGMDIEAELGATFRVINGISTDAQPEFMCMFGTNEVLNNVSWYGLEMDMNGANNLFSPRRGEGIYQLYNQASIHVTGTVSGVAARINNATIDTCRFVGSYGVSCVVMGQSNTVDSGLGRNWTMRNNTFYDNGYDTIDHSSVYGWAENVTVEENNFSNPTQLAVNGTGGLVAYEIHGSHTTFARNRVRKYYQGLWIDGNSTAISYSVQVLNNTLDEIGAFGILYFGQSSTAAPIIGSLVQGNQITLDDTVYPGIDLKYGIGTAGQYSQTDISIKDNYVRGLGNVVAKAGVAVTAGTIVGQKHDRWLIERNTCKNVSAGVALFTNATVGLGTMEVRDNVAINLVPAGVLSQPQGVAVASGGALIDDVSIIRNIATDDRTTPLTAFGVRVEGAVGRYTMYDNRASRVSSAEYAEAGFSAVSRRGRFLTLFPYDPAPLATNAATFADVTVPNAEMGDVTSATMNVPLQGVTMTSWVQSPGVVRVNFQNSTASTADIGSGTIFVTLNRMV